MQHPTAPADASTSSPRALLETKLYVPRSPRRLVPRGRLERQLDRGAQSAITLVSAPAGFGKSTALSDWLATTNRSAAWLSIDAGDNDAGVFWSYVVAALRTVAPAIRDDVLRDSALPGISHDVLTSILNDVSALQSDVILVLDDYHVIESVEVHESMAFVLEHMPPRLHLIIASRADPPLPLARWRAAGELVEVRAADLRFTVDEIATYFGEVMQLPLTEKDLDTLGARTEGWIAALQLAALSIRGRDDVSGFVDSFAGDDRYIVDYLVEEVLLNQSSSVRSFLLRTSVLSRMSAALCDAVTGEEDGVEMLRALDQANLFLVPLDDRRRWYRYHHLFAEVLQARLVDELPDVIPELHRRASAWFAQHGETEAAVQHAIAAADFALAAHLIESAYLELTRHRRESMLREWMDAFPDEIFRTRPVLSLAYVGALLSTGEVEGVEARLRDAERWAGAASADGAAPEELIVVDQDEFRRLPASIAIYRAGLALSLGDSASTTRFALRALDLIGDDDPFRRGAASALRGLALWGGGSLDEGHDAYAEAVACFRRSGHVADVLGCTIILADVRLTQGRLGEAWDWYEQAMRLAREQGGPRLRGIPDMHVGMSDILRERGDSHGAARHLALAHEVGEHGGLPKYRYRSRLAMAQLLAQQGDGDRAVQLLDEAQRAYVADMAPDVRPVAAYRARMLLRQGRTAEAAAWARQRGLSAHDDLTYVREFEHITFARLLLTTDRPQALALLDRLRAAADAGGRIGNLIEILVLQALAHHRRDDVAAAAAIEWALELAEPEGYVRIFADEGAPMEALLHARARGGAARDYERVLLEHVRTHAEPALPAHSVSPSPLSEREREVLRLLGTELSGPEIARHLVVSLNTVRTHTKNIYAKLGVTNRRAAVRRAAELGVMSSS